MWLCSDSQAQNAIINSNGTITINSLCLDTSGSSIVLNTCSGATSQTWTPGTGHTLVNGASGQRLQATSQSNGASLTTASCSSSNVNQQWWQPAV
jgi:alpha-galactosidase